MKKDQDIFEKRKNTLFFVLAGIFIVNALLAEIIGVKIFSASHYLKTLPGFGEGFDYSLSAGVVLWPVVFVTTDIINEYFGKKGVRKISFTTAALISYAFVCIYIVTALQPATFWLDVNNTDPDGKAFNINYAFVTIFRQGLGIIIGSLISFLVGQIVDSYTFSYFKKLTGSKMIWLRATCSTLFSQLIDSFLVLYIAFYLIGQNGKFWTLDQVIHVGISNYIYKFCIAILLIPVLYVAHYWIDKYLGKEADGDHENEPYSDSK